MAIENKKTFLEEKIRRKEMIFVIRINEVKQ